MRILPSLVLACYACILLSFGAILFTPTEARQSDIAEMPSTALPSRLQFTVVTPGYESATSLIAPFGPGFERELVAEFCKPYDCDIRFVQAGDRDTALTMLQKGQADAAVGFAGLGEALTGVVAGPAYYHSEQISVSAWGPENPAVKAARGNATGTEKAESAETPGLALPDFSVAQAEEGRQYLLDGRSWSIWEPFAVLVKDGVEATADGKNDYHWFWRSANASLSSRLAAFWEGLQDKDNTVLAQLEDRYYGYLPESVNPYAVADLMDLLKRRLPRYASTIARASDRADINPLLFTAVIIQESRLDEGTVSTTGVRGIMQLTQNTANFLKVDRMDPVASIHAGARYLQMLWKDLEPLELDVWDRWFFTLAAFNQGPRRLEGAMELSKKLGGTGRTWSELKGVYPLLTQKKYADMIGQSVFRGKEAVAFVERVRMNYHIMRGLVALERPEAQNLAPLLRGFDVSALGF